MSGLDRWLPRLITGLGVVHLLFGVVESRAVLRDMLADGVVGTADLQGRGYVIWFVVGGLAMLALGAVAGWAVRTAGRLPEPLGWWLTGIGVVISVTEPVSGGYLVSALGVLTVVAARRSVRADVPIRACALAAAKAARSARTPDASAR